jgi:hypothetical protein
LSEAFFESSLPYEEGRIRAAAVYCSDGRIGEQIDEFLHHGLALPRYDRVAVPGGPVCLAGRLLAFWEARGVEDQLRFLARVHDIERVVLIGHASCAFYTSRLRIPEAALEGEQLADLARAARVVAGLGHELVAETYFARRAGTAIRFEAAPP